MTPQCGVRTALTEERSKAEISLGFAVSRRDQVLLQSKINPRIRKNTGILYAFYVYLK